MRNYDSSGTIKVSSADVTYMAVAPGTQEYSQMQPGQQNQANMSQQSMMQQQPPMMPPNANMSQMQPNADMSQMSQQQQQSMMNNNMS